MASNVEVQDARSRGVGPEVTALIDGADGCNPFINQTTRSLSTYERVKLVVMAPVAVLRIAIVLLSFMACGLLVRLILVGYPVNTLATKPFVGKRRELCDSVIKGCVRVVLFALGYYWIRYKGVPSSREDAPMVVCNHSTFLDPLVLGLIFAPASVGAAEHLNIPVLGVVFRALQTITVERTNHDSRHAVRQTIETRARGPGWPRILIFPEATCTNGTALINFKTGPFSPGQPVQPVICTFPHRHFHPAWISGTSGMRILYRLCCQFVNHCEVEFLPRYVPSDAEVASPHLFANNVRRVMAEAMRVPMTSHSYDDVRLQIHAARIGVPESDAVVGMAEVKLLFKADSALVQKHMDAFAALDTNGSGTIDYDEFARGFGFEDSPMLRQLFDLLDIHSDGRLDFREYLLGLALANEQGDREAVIKLAFHSYDVDGDAGLSREELGRFLARSGYSDLRVEEAFSGKGVDERLQFDEFREFCRSNDAALQVFTDRFAEVTEKMAAQTLSIARARGRSGAKKRGNRGQLG